VRTRYDSALVVGGATQIRARTVEAVCGPAKEVQAVGISLARVLALIRLLVTHEDVVLVGGLVNHALPITPAADFLAELGRSVTGVEAWAVLIAGASGLAQAVGADLLLGAVLIGQTWKTGSLCCVLTDGEIADEPGGTRHVVTAVVEEAIAGRDLAGVFGRAEVDAILIRGATEAADPIVASLRTLIGAVLSGLTLAADVGVRVERQVLVLACPKEAD